MQVICIFVSEFWHICWRIIEVFLFIYLFELPVLNYFHTTFVKWWPFCISSGYAQNYPKKSFTLSSASAMKWPHFTFENLYDVELIVELQNAPSQKKLSNLKAGLNIPAVLLTPCMRLFSWNMFTPTWTRQLWLICLEQIISKTWALTLCYSRRCKKWLWDGFHYIKDWSVFFNWS